MKRISLIFVVLLAAVAVVQAQVPSEVKVAFKKKYPKATGTEWIATDDQFEATFTSKEMELTATYSLDGEWIVTIGNCTYTALPDKVVDALDKKYNKPFYEKSVYEEHPSSQKFYRMTLEVKESIVYVTISSDGQIISEERAEQAEVEDDEEDY
jgi:hypothetical protein